MIDVGVSVINVSVTGQHDPIGGVDRMSSRATPERAAIRLARKLVSEIRRRRLRPCTGGEPVPSTDRPVAPAVWHQDHVPSVTC